MGGGIPISEIREYINEFGISDPDERTEWLILIREMDIASMRGESAKQEEERKKREAQQNARSKHQN